MQIVVHAVVIFVFLWVVTRAVGRANLAEITTFELLIYVTMGDLIQQAVTQQDYSLTSACVAVGIFALLSVGLSWVSWRFPRLRPIIRGNPVLVIRDGTPLIDVMKRQRLTIDDLMTSAREQGIRYLSRVDVAVLETDGRISFFEAEQGGGGSGDSGDSGDSDGAGDAGAPSKSRASE